MSINNILHLLHFYLSRKKFAKYSSIDGWLTKREALGLFTIGSGLPENAVVVEIGTWKGKSTYCIASGLKSGKIYSIDPFDASGEVESEVVYHEKKGTIPLLDQFVNRMKELGVFHKITPLKGFSSEFVGKFDGIDFLFIDGDHSIQGTDFDFTNFAPKVKKGGLIAFHDYYANRNELGPTWVIKNKVLTSTDFKFENLYDSLWVAKKTV